MGNDKGYWVSREEYDLGSAGEVQRITAREVIDLELVIISDLNVLDKQRHLVGPGAKVQYARKRSGR